MPDMPLSQHDLSLAKDRIRILLLEGVSDSAVATLNGAGYATITRIAKALDEDALVELSEWRLQT